MIISVFTVVIFAFGCYVNNVPLMLSALLILVLRLSGDDGDE